MSADEETSRKRNPKFNWNEFLSTFALREIYFTKPYQHESGTTESAKKWKECVVHLIEHRGEDFQSLTVDKLRDHIRNILA